MVLSLIVNTIYSSSHLSIHSPRTSLGTVTAGFAEVVLPVGAEGSVDQGVTASVAHSDGLTSGDMGAGHNAALTVDTLVGVIAQEGVIVHLLAAQDLTALGIGRDLHAVIVAVHLQLAGSVTFAAEAVAGVLTEQQLQNGLSGLHDPLGAGVDDHAFLCLGITGSDHDVHALDLHQTKTAGTDIADALQIAQSRDMDPGLFGRLEYGHSFRCFYDFSVDGQ